MFSGWASFSVSSTRVHKTKYPSFFFPLSSPSTHHFHLPGFHHRHTGKAEALISFIRRQSSKLCLSTAFNPALRTQKETMTAIATLFNILTAPRTAKTTTIRSLPISLTPSFLTTKDPSPFRGLTAPAPPRLNSRVVAARAAKANRTGEQKWTQEGSVTESLPNGMFRVLLDNQDLIIGYISGKIRKNFIRILPGDRVKVEVSRYDTTRGRIVYRHKSSKDPGSD